MSQVAKNEELINRFLPTEQPVDYLIEQLDEIDRFRADEELIFNAVELCCVGAG